MCDSSVMTVTLIFHREDGRIWRQSIRLAGGHRIGPVVGHPLDSCPRCGERLLIESAPGADGPARAECMGSPQHVFDVVNEGTKERPRYRLGDMLDPSTS